MSFVSAHVLDAAAGRPAAGIVIRLADAAGTDIATAVTDIDGRVADLGPDELAPGDYQITFAVADYFAAERVDSFYPRVTVHFTVVSGQAHYHIPLLLSPFAYTTYRGS